MESQAAATTKPARGGRRGGDRKKSVSKSIKSGLQFPVGRISRYLKKVVTRPDTTKKRSSSQGEKASPAKKSPKKAA